MKKVTLKKGKERSISRKHPWVFSGAIAHVEDDISNGETVMICDCSGAFMAYGAYSPSSKIALKIWSFCENDVIDTDFFADRIAKAYNLRKKIFSNGLPDAYRLVNAESDGLPGLVADVFSKRIVCQITSSGMELHRDAIASILATYAPDGVYERSDVESRVKDGLEKRSGVMTGSDVPPFIEIEENSIRFKCSIAEGHKTGFYLDQRTNRLEVMNAAHSCDTVLNCFCYTGGFGLAALKGGAKNVLNVDTSGAALEIAKDNARLNGFSEDEFQTLEADVFKFLRTCRDSRKTFDMIILDPPKFAESQSQREKAARGYKDINLLALKLLNPGGKLFTFSCSGAMDDDLFGKVFDSAALDSGADVRIIKLLSQGPDHVVSTAFPEGRYLKGIYAVKI